MSLSQRQLVCPPIWSLHGGLCYWHQHLRLFLCCYEVCSYRGTSDDIFQFAKKFTKTPCWVFFHTNATSLWISCEIGCSWPCAQWTWCLGNWSGQHPLHTSKEMKLLAPVSRLATSYVEPIGFYGLLSSLFRSLGSIQIRTSFFEGGVLFSFACSLSNLHSPATKDRFRRNLAFHPRWFSPWSIHFNPKFINSSLQKHYKPTMV